MTPPAVDGQLANTLSWVLELTVAMLMKFFAVVSFSPVFAIPGLIVSMVGGWCGQIYMKAQLSVKREMSNARAPVLGHFGAAIAGLSTSSSFRWRSCVALVYDSMLMLCLQSLHPCIRRAGPVQEGVVPPHRQIHPCWEDVLQPQPLGLRPY